MAIGNGPRFPEDNAVEGAKPSTKERILEAALAVFAQKGYHGAIVDDIVRDSDTSKGSFYFHFPNKEGVFLALIERLTELLARRVEAAIDEASGGVNKVDAALCTVIRGFSEHRSLAKILLVDVAGLGHHFDRKMMEVHSRFSRLIKAHLDRAVAEGDIPALDTAVASDVWLGAINEVVIRWLITGAPARLDDALPALRTMLLRSIGAAEVTDRGSA